MDKNFNQWNNRKKALHASNRGQSFFYYEREIWWCAIGANVGVEIDGKHNLFERPVLILKKFNANMFWGIPMTSRGRTGPFYQEVAIGGGASSWAVLSQIRTWSSKRLLRKIWTASEEDFREIRDRLRKII